jgi:hypothetical protein
LKVASDNPLWYQSQLTTKELERLLGRKISVPNLLPGDDRPTKRQRVDPETLLRGLSNDSKHKLLVKAALKHSDILDDIQATLKAQSAQTKTFSREVARADDVLHSLDDLKPRHQFDRSHQVSFSNVPSGFGARLI